MVNLNRTKRFLFDPKCTKIARRLGEFTALPHTPSCYRGGRGVFDSALNLNFLATPLFRPNMFSFRLHAPPSPVYSHNLNICTGDSMTSNLAQLCSKMSTGMIYTEHCIINNCIFQNTAMNVDSSRMIPTGNQIQHSKRNPLAGEKMSRK